MCLGPVADQPALVVELVGPEVLALGADPHVVIVVVLEAGGPVAQRAPVGMCRQPFEQAGAHQKRERVGGREQCLGAHVTLAAAASSELTSAPPSAASTSVKRMSSGSSRVTRLTVCRTPM